MLSFNTYFYLIVFNRDSQKISIENEKIIIALKTVKNLKKKPKTP